MTSLLDKALQVRTRNHKTPKFIPEEVELALASLRGDVSDGQVSVAAGMSRANTPTWVLSRLRYAYREGSLKIADSLS